MLRVQLLAIIPYGLVVISVFLGKYPMTILFFLYKGSKKKVTRKVKRKSDNWDIQGQWVHQAVR